MPTDNGILNTLQSYANEAYQQGVKEGRLLERSEHVCSTLAQTVDISSDKKYILWLESTMEENKIKKIEETIDKLKLRDRVAVISNMKKPEVLEFA